MAGLTHEMNVRTEPHGEKPVAMHHADPLEELVTGSVCTTATTSSIAGLPAIPRIERQKMPLGLETFLR